jgi:molecular chaperone GrpE
MSDPTNAGDAADLETVEPEAPSLTAEERLARLESEKQELNEKFLRVLADLDNTRKRAEREVSEARVYAVGRFAGDLLSVADNLARALSALPEAERESLTDAGKNLLGGIEMTEKELHTVLTRHNVLPVDAAPGSAFDPNIHQAVAQIPSEHAAGTIAQLFQPGWRIGERTLRAAMVAVSLGPAN